MSASYYLQSIKCFPLGQSSDADIVARSAEDGGGEQERADGYELHKGSQWRSATDCVCGDTIVRDVGHEECAEANSALVCVI